jgi:hypothetical protein
MEIAAALNGTNGPKRNILRDIACQLLDQAAQGNLTAINEVADRLDGKPGQQITAQNELRLQLERIERVVIDPMPQTSQIEGTAVPIEPKVN